MCSRRVFFIVLMVSCNAKKWIGSIYIYIYICIYVYIYMYIIYRGNKAGFVRLCRAVLEPNLIPLEFFGSACPLSPRSHD